MIHFDAYTATTRQANPYQLIEILEEVAGEGSRATQGNGFHAFGKRTAYKDQAGIEVGAVQWGGSHGDLSMIEVKGAGTGKAVEALRARFWHRVSRVDACADFDAPGAFESLLAPCLEVKAAHRLKGGRFGDWDDFPEDGRTLMLGSPSSVARVRLYEKGKQPEYRHLSRKDWTRIEVQVRPAKEAKAAFAELTPREVWGASKWTRDLAGKCLAEHVDPHPAGTTYRLTEDEAAIRWMCDQYGARLLTMFEDLGSWQAVGLTLGETISAQRAKKGQQ